MKIKDCCNCDVCDFPQTIEHLLFNCSYVKPIWSLVEETINDFVTFKRILGVDIVFKFHNFVSVIAYIIYKEWLVHSLDNRKRGRIISTLYFKYELKIRLSIYEFSKSYNDNEVMCLMNNMMLKIM